MDKTAEKELFETIPVRSAVATLAIPTIISQIVSIIYNLADTFFIGQMGNPYMVAAATLVYPWFALLTALGNRFGIGGSSLASRMLGAKKEKEPCCANPVCKCTGYLYIAGYGQRGTVIGAYGMQAGTFEYSDACYYELDIWALRDDLDTVGNRTDYAPGHTGYVCRDVEEADKAVPKLKERRRS